MTSNILRQFGLIEGEYDLQLIGNGLINNTWSVNNKDEGEKFILQRINRSVFGNPEDIAFNIRLLANYLKQEHPDYFFVSTLKTKSGQELAYEGEEVFRLFPFVKGSHTLDTVQNPGQAYEASKQFGRFTCVTKGLDPSKLRITIPDFHHLSLRFQQFERALINGNKERIRQSRELILYLQQQINIAGKFEFEKSDLKMRVTHHDTKISNVLFDENDRGVCVIDLDTLMPGYFISDVGDMMRTYLSPANEEEKDFSKIIIRPEFYKAIVDGYLSEMSQELTDFEKGYFHYAGKYMIYMQALRFLTDHINNDIYYGSRYEGHNLIRAGNQVTLLKRMTEFDPSPHSKVA